MALEHIDAYPWFLNKNLDIVVSEQLVHTRIKASEWTDSWRPFLARMYDLWLAHRPGRFLVGIAGPPGVGKSVFAEQLNFMIDRGILHRDAHSVALPMDGFHFPNEYLARHTRSLSDGTKIPLSSVKGQPDTIDIARLRESIQHLKERHEYVSWPGYNRFLHDVEPGKYRVHQSTDVVIIEGNYLLVNRGAFAGLPAMFDLRVYIEGPGTKIVADLVERHVRGGKSLEEAKDWVKRIDLPNARVAEASKANADAVIERNADDDLESVEWKDSPAQT